MSIPNLKRIKISSVQDLKNWLGKSSADQEKVMIVTCDKTSPTKFVSSETVRKTLTEHGWSAERSYTLKGNLVGHVAVPT